MLLDVEVSDTTKDQVKDVLKATGGKSISVEQPSTVGRHGNHTRQTMTVIPGEARAALFYYKNYCS